MIWNLYPEKWIPLYPMIAFRHIPFTEVIERNELQKKMILDLIASNKLHEKNASEIEIQQFLEPFIREVAAVA